MAAELIHLYRSPGHNFVGHHGKPPGESLMHEVETLECIAGRGIVGDRYFDFAPDFEGQITFFASEVHELLCARFGPAEPNIYRRNVITRGVPISEWIGVEFQIQGVRFRGTEEAKPCYWMDTAVAPGACELLRGRGGVRAQILSSGTLRRGLCG